MNSNIAIIDLANTAQFADGKLDRSEHNNKAGRWQLELLETRYVLENAGRSVSKQDK